MTYFLFYLCIWLTLYRKESKAVLAEETLRYVCSGDSIQLFRNITIDTIDTVVSLYINASNERNLAKWTSESNAISEGYKTKVFLDKNGDIWIRDVSPSDEAQYILMTGKGTNVFRSIVTLRVQVAPTNNCKPAIKRVDNVLVASLNAKECGNPLVSVDWLDNPGIQNEGNTFMLPKTNKYGIYYACISGPAVKCAKASKSSDFCSAYPIRDTPDSHDDSGKPGIEHNVSTYFVVMLIPILLVLALVIVLIFRTKCTNVTLCGIKNGTKDVKRCDYNAVPTTTELSDVSHPPEKISVNTI